jgi:hypothetical protein
MKRNTLWLAVSLASLGAGSVAAQSYPYSGYNPEQAQTVRCESQDSRQETCRIAAGSDVRLVQQLSRQSCIEGRNWSHSDTRITVTDGCRADFLVTADRRWNDDDRYGDNRDGDGRYRDGRYGDGRYENNSGHTIHCASRSRRGGRTLCGTDMGDYSIVGRSRNCVEGRTWGNAQRGVWVSGKCSANFRLSADYRRDRDGRDDRDWRSDRNDRRHDAFARSLNCESTGNWRTYCGDAREGPYTLRDRGNRYCVEGSTWGNDARGLWVSGPCRAVFDRPMTYRNDVHPSVEVVTQRD